MEFSAIPVQKPEPTPLPLPTPNDSIGRALMELRGPTEALLQEIWKEFELDLGPPSQLHRALRAIEVLKLAAFLRNGVKYCHWLKCLDTFVTINRATRHIEWRNRNGKFQYVYGLPN